MVQLSAVIPCYNGDVVLHELRKRLVPVCEAETTSFEVVLVDDGSSDCTKDLIRAFTAEDPRFVAVIPERNHGHQIALTAGLQAVRGARILVLDADLQDPPELLGDMMRKMDEGFDVVYVQRRARGRDAVQENHRQCVLPSATANERCGYSRRHRGFQADEPPGERCLTQRARTAPLHSRHDHLGRLFAGGHRIRPRRALCGGYEISLPQDAGLCHGIFLARAADLYACGLGARRPS